MPFEFRNTRTLLQKAGVSLEVCELWQVDFTDRADTPMGQRYIVHNGQAMIQSSTLQRAEEIMSEVLSGTRSLAPPATEPGEGRTQEGDCSPRADTRPRGADIGGTMEGD